MHVNLEKIILNIMPFRINSALLCRYALACLCLAVVLPCDASPKAVVSNPALYNKAPSLDKQESLQPASKTLIDSMLLTESGRALVDQAQKYDFAFYAIHRHAPLKAGNIMLEKTETIADGDRIFTTQERELKQHEKDAVPAVWVLDDKEEWHVFEYASREIYDELKTEELDILEELKRYIIAESLQQTVGIRRINKKNKPLKANEKYYEDNSHHSDSGPHISTVRVVNENHVDSITTAIAISPSLNDVNLCGYCLYSCDDDNRTCSGFRL